MTQQKSTKRALLSGVLAMLLCVAMLIGATFAWFTDTASTAVNKIQSGSLKLSLKMRNNESDEWVNADGETLNFLRTDGTKLSADANILWEPGATYKLPQLKISNEGSLALKYKVVISGATGDTDLLSQIDFTSKVNGGAAATFTDGATLVTDKQLLPKEGTNVSSDTINIEGTMKATADNKYQNKTITGISITVVATQSTYEKDSMSDQYDKDAQYPVVVSQNKLNTTLALSDLTDDNGTVSPVEVSLGDLEPEQLTYHENNSGARGKGVMLGNKQLNKYAARPAEIGKYKFTFKDGIVNSAATGYGSIDNFKDTSVYMLVPGNSDVVFENMTFNGVVSFDIQKYTTPWSELNSLTFKNCKFNGIIIGTCYAANVTFDGCEFTAYTNTVDANNSNPIWWREDTEGSGNNANPIKTFVFTNNKVTGTRPVKIERIGHTVSPTFTIKNNQFDISKQATDTNTKNMAINIGMGERPNLPFTLIDDGNTISSNTASLYTASISGGSNYYKEIPGMKVVDGNGKDKIISALVWKTTTGETFEIKTIH